MAGEEQEDLDEPDRMTTTSAMTTKLKSSAATGSHSRIRSAGAAAGSGKQGRRQWLAEAVGAGRGGG
jgi:hypothetical protein